MEESISAVFQKYHMKCSAGYFSVWKSVACYPYHQHQRHKQAFKGHLPENVPKDKTRMLQVQLQSKLGTYQSILMQESVSMST